MEKKLTEKLICKPNRGNALFHLLGLTFSSSFELDPYAFNHMYKFYL